MKTSNMDALRAQLLAFRPGCEQEEQDRRLMLHDMDLFPDLLTRKNELAHFTASCWIVGRDRRQVLMAYHNIYQISISLGPGSAAMPTARQICWPLHCAKLTRNPELRESAP